MMRKAIVARKTNETDVKVTLVIDGKGSGKIETGVGFLDHMLTLFAKHGRFDLSVSCKGDTDVDFHHSTEDIGICLGQAFRTALGDMRGITRYGSLILPMDEALILASCDISGRGMMFFSLDIPAQKVGDFDTELVEEFFNGFARNAGITLHIKQLDGRNSHHIIEGAFKASARCIREAVKIDPELKDEIPSTKGII